MTGVPSVLQVGVYYQGLIIMSSTIASGESLEESPGPQDVIGPQETSVTF